jgi:hypothetical protein
MECVDSSLFHETVWPKFIYNYGLHIFLTVSLSIVLFVATSDYQSFFSTSIFLSIGVFEDGLQTDRALSSPYG